MKPKPLTASELNAYIKAMPLNQTLGVNVVRVYRDGLTMELTIHDGLKNGMGTLHGGVIATLIDAAAGFAVIGHLGGQRKTTTVELKVNYLRPAAEGKVRARARFLKFGQTLVVIGCDVSDTHGHLIATSLVTYMLL